jgi:hypothetical protein
MRGKAGLFSRFVPFSPNSLAGLTAWWDASDSSTLFDADTGGSATAADGEVGRLEDKSGLGHNFTQATSANRPARKTAVQNGLDVLRLDGTNDRMLTSQAFSTFFGSTQSTVFVACKATSVGTNSTDPYSNETVLAAASSAHGFVMLRSNSTAGAYGYDSNYRTASLSYVAGVWKVFTTTHSASTLGFRINKSSPATASLGTRDFLTQGLYLGANWNNSAFFDGDVGEIITYNVALSDADREKVEDYLMDKWGIT